ncbi:MAG: ribosome silencing factor [Clostridia bacterium]
MKTEKLLDIVVKTLDEKNGGDIKTLYVTEKTSIADYFVIATGKNITHVRALAESVEEKLEEEGVFAARKEGIKEGRWAVIDYITVIVHIFNSDTRDFYCLEKLWQ